MTSFTIDFPPTLPLAEYQFAEICQNNRDLRFELNSNGSLIAMAPTGSDTGNCNMDISGQLWLWNRRSQLGYTFDSSSGFRLPNGAIRAPDAAWIACDRWEALSRDEQAGFAPICPDFVIELRSTTDRLAPLRTKMTEYLECGARLGWLLDRDARCVEVFDRARGLSVLEGVRSVSAEAILPGFVLDLSQLW